MQSHEHGLDMGVITAQVSLYPLRQVAIGPAIREAMRVFGEYGLEIRIGEMSTLVWREEQAVFNTLQEAFHQAAERGDVVMAVTFSNACPGGHRDGSAPSRRKAAIMTA